MPSGTPACRAVAVRFEEKVVRERHTTRRRREIVRRATSKRPPGRHGDSVGEERASRRVLRPRAAADVTVQSRYGPAGACQASRQALDAQRGRGRSVDSARRSAATDLRASQRPPQSARVHSVCELTCESGAGSPTGSRSRRMIVGVLALSPRRRVMLASGARVPGQRAGSSSSGMSGRVP